MYLTYLLGTKKNGGELAQLLRKVLAYLVKKIVTIITSVVAINYTEV